MAETTPFEQAWQPWVDAVAGAVEVDPSAVPVAEVQALAREVSDHFTRPMAPVAAHLWGLARAAHPERDPAEHRAAILDALPQDRA